MLLEAILSVVIASICLTFIAQSLLTNFRSGLRFQETVRALMAMENRLGILYATNASEDQMALSPQSMEKPYDRYNISAKAEPINDHLNKIALQLGSPAGRTRLDLTTVIYDPDATHSAS